MYGSFRLCFFKIVTIKSMVAATTMASISISVMVPALATNDPQRNDFGHGASHLGQTNQMGEHYSDPSNDGRDDPDPRVGIGNVFDQGDPKDDLDSKHPADTANRLCPSGSTDPLCP
jgi:hypothetical protein